MDLRSRCHPGQSLSVAALPFTVLPCWSGRVQVASDAAVLAERVATSLAQALEADPGRILGLATGRTMEPIYAALVRKLGAWPAQQQADLRRRWRSFNLDEYVGLAAGDPRSFAATMRQQLGDPLGLGQAQLRLPDGRAEDPGQEASHYGQAIADAGVLSLQLLGLGLNGHVGFNEPPCLASAACRCLELSASTREQNSADFGGDPMAGPSLAITLGLAEILQAQRIVLVVSGGGKARILRRLLQDPPDPALPASWLQGHPGAELWVDAAALGA